jgi:hypothetical protein
MSQTRKQVATRELHALQLRAAELFAAADLARQHADALVADLQQVSVCDACGLVADVDVFDGRHVLTRLETSDGWLLGLCCGRVTRASGVEAGA